MIAELLTALWHSTVASSVAIAVVFAIRRPLRRLFGCGAAYGAWLAVPLCTAAAIAPPPANTAWTLPVVPARFAAVRVVQWPADAPSPLWPSLVVAVWSLGVVGAVAGQVRLQRSFVRSLGPLVVTGDIAVSESLVAGPSLIGLWRPLIAVPADFERRYTPRERELIVAHERAHARHGDLFVNASCAALRCLWWFNPLVHFATRIVRADQELTRDAELMRLFPDARHPYASALLKAQCVAIDSPVACHWPSRHPLKERLMNLTRNTPTAVRRLGTMVVCLAMGGASFAAWAAQGTSEVDPGRLEHARWTDAKPSVDLTVGPGPKPAQFLVQAVIKDLVTGQVLGKPRLLTVAGTPASIEVATERVGVRIVVTVDPSGREARYTTEILREGRIESSQAGTLALALADREAPPVSAASAIAEAAADAGPYRFDLSFSSSDARELGCAADVFAARGDAGLAGALRAPADGKVHAASFSTTTPTIDRKANDVLIAALSKCQLGVDSNLAWKVVQP